MNEQEMREFLKHELEKCADGFAVALKTKLDSMSPMATSWMPCNIALPPKSGRYMVTIKSKAKRRTEMRNFDFESQTWEAECKWNPENIIAWQERPAPYIPKE